MSFNIPLHQGQSVFKFTNHPICILFVVDFVLDQRNVSPLQAYDKWRAWADEKVCCDYGFHVGITWWSEQVAKDMEVLVKEKGKWSVNGY